MRDSGMSDPATGHRRRAVRPWTRSVVQRRVRIACIVILATVVLGSCDLALYEADRLVAAARTEELSEAGSVTVTGWDLRDTDDRLVEPTGWYPDQPAAAAGFLIAEDEGAGDLVVVRVVDAAAVAEARIRLEIDDVMGSWDAWIVPIGPVVQESYLSANPDAPARVPALVVAQYGAEDSGEVSVSGVLWDSAGDGLSQTDMRSRLDALVQTAIGSAGPFEILSLQVVPHGRGATLTNGTVTTSSGAILQVLARNTTSGQSGVMVAQGDGIAVADWIATGADTGLTTTTVGSSFVIPARSDGARPGLLRHATLVEGGPVDVVSFPDDDYTGAPWRSFGRAAGGTFSELDDPVFISSVTVEGILRSGRSGGIDVVAMADLPNAEARREEWGTLWYAGVYPTGATTGHAATNVYTQIGIAATLEGPVLELTTFRD